MVIVHLFKACVVFRTFPRSTLYSLKLEVVNMNGSICLCTLLTAHMFSRRYQSHVCLEENFSNHTTHYRNPEPRPIFFRKLPRQEIYPLAANLQIISATAFHVLKKLKSSKADEECGSNVQGGFTLQFSIILRREEMIMESCLQNQGGFDINMVLSGYIKQYLIIIYP